MRELRWVVIGGIAILTLIVGFYLLAQYFLQQPIEEVREAQELKAKRTLLQEEQRLLEAKAQYNQSYVRAKKALQAVEAQKQTTQHPAYGFTLLVGESFLNLWPIWAVALGVTLLFTQRHRLQQQVEFVFGEIKSMIPAKEAVRLTEAAIQAKEKESDVKALAFQDDLTHRKLQDGLGMVRTLKSFVPKEKVVSQPIDIEPASLPAFTGNVYYSQLLLDAEPGHIPYGRDMETGNIIQIPFKPLQSVVKLGKQGFGKSESTKPEILTALDMKYVQKLPIRLHIIDSHYGLEDALTTEIEPVLPLFDTALLGSEVLKSDKILSFLQGQILDAETRQARKVRESDPWDLIFFDEYTSLVENHPKGKEIEKKVKELLNLRKARKFLSICVYDSSKNDNSVRGMNPARLGISQLIFNTSEQQAAQLIGWSDYAKKAPGLSEGQCLIKLPKSKHVENEVSLCQCALVTDTDLLKYIQYLPSENAKIAPQLTNGQDMKDTSEVSDEFEAELTPELCKEQRKEWGWTQKDLAERSGVHVSTIKKFESGRSVNWKEGEVLSLTDTLFPPQKDNVVNFRTVNRPRT